VWQKSQPRVAESHLTLCDCGVRLEYPPKELLKGPALDTYEPTLAKEPAFSVPA